MGCIDYIKLGHVEPAEFLPILNKGSTRKHLLEHPLFDTGTVTAWLAEKIRVDSSAGCKVRAILVDKQLAGWCGIQKEGNTYEIAIVLDEDYRGLGRRVFRDVIAWARDLGHNTVYIHLLHTRPGYRFLRKMSKTVYESELLGDKFTTYELEVDRFA